MSHREKCASCELLLRERASWLLLLRDTRPPRFSLAGVEEEEDEEEEDEDEEDEDEEEEEEDAEDEEEEEAPPGKPNTCTEHLSVSSALPPPPYASNRSRGCHARLPTSFSRAMLCTCSPEWTSAMSMC